MDLNVHRILAGALAATFLTACSSGPKINAYHAPNPSQPSAELIILPASEVLPRNESERLDVRDTQCPSNDEQKSGTMNLARWSRSGEVKPVQVALPAGRTYLRYEKDQNRESCAISFSAKLEAGHSYALQSGKKYMGWLKGSSCLVSLFDISAKSPVILDYESANAVYDGSCQKPAQPPQSGSPDERRARSAT